jgi:hypothetical protein
MPHRNTIRRSPSTAKAHKKSCQRFEVEMRRALVGARLSWNSTWAEQEFCPSDCEKAVAVARARIAMAAKQFYMPMPTQNALEFVQEVLVKWSHRWTIVLTVCSQDSKGKLFYQDSTATEQGKMVELEDFIEGEMLEAAKADCKGKKIIEWSYFAEITA